MLPRDDKKHHTKFPSMEGCRAAAGWSENARKRFRSVPRYAAPHISVIASHRRWRGNLFFVVVSLGRCCVARALMRPVRILVFVQTALALVFTYSDSLRAQRSNPVNYVVAYATHIAFTGSPRSQCSPAMIKSTTPSSPLWRGAAQRRSGQRMQESVSALSPDTLPHTSLSLRAIADGVAIQ